MATKSTCQPENPFADNAATDQDVNDDVVEAAAAPGFKKYLMYYTASRFHARIHSGSKTSPATYFLQSSVSQSDPQYLLRRGDSKTSPMINFAYFPRSSRHILLGKGDFRSQPESRVVGEEMRRGKNLMHRSDYQFGTPEGSATGQRVEYEWRKRMEVRLRTIYDCVAGDGRVVAKFFSGGVSNWRKGAEIEILEGMEEGLEEILVMSALAVWASEGRAFRSIFSGLGSANKES
ncbi:MAG: hypothetical protein Q9160_007564 [Pyrenula sp. 1 TL-2023]